MKKIVICLILSAILFCTPTITVLGETTTISSPSTTTTITENTTTIKSTTTAENTTTIKNTTTVTEDTTTSVTKNTTTVNKTTSATTTKTGTTTTRKLNTSAKSTRKDTKTTLSNQTTAFIGSTGKQDQYVTVDFTFHTDILSAFSTTEDTVKQKAKLLLTPEVYENIIGEINGVLFVEATPSELNISDEDILKTIQSNQAFSNAEGSQLQYTMLNLTVKAAEKQGGHILTIRNVESSSFIVQLPVPENMQQASSILISAVSADGVSNPIVATVSKDGYMQFEISRPTGTIAIIGYDGGVLGTLFGHSLTLAIVFLVIGLLCIGGALFLFFKFIFIPKKSKKNEQEAKGADDEIKELSPLSDEQPVAFNEENQHIDPLFDLDIFSEDTPKPKTKNPADYDLPL